MYTVKLKPIKFKMSGAKEVFDKEMLRTMNEVSVDLKNSMMITSNKNTVTGTLRNSWQAIVATLSGKTVKGGTASTAVQALTLNNGTKAHMPPTAAIAQWVKRRRENAITDDKKANQMAWRIAVTFAKMKRAGSQLFDKTFKKMQPKIDLRFDKMLDRIQKGMGF